MKFGLRSSLSSIQHPARGSSRRPSAPAPPCTDRTARPGRARRVSDLRRPGVAALALLIGLCAAPACPASARAGFPADSSAPRPALLVAFPAPSLSEPEGDAQEARLEIGPDGRDLRLTGDLD